jgi:TRAP-type C4-dicarboxylate transport system substrate-binding protein
MPSRQDDFRAPHRYPARLATCAVTAVLLAFPALARGETPTTKRIKLATLAPKGTSFHHVLLAMGEQWRQAPGGGVALAVYTDGTMGGEADMVRRMRVGQIQAALLTVTGLAEIDDSVTALQNMPMMFRSLDEVAFVREKLRGGLEQRFKEKGFIVLFWGDAGWVHFFSQKRAVLPDDYKKMKMFALVGDTKTNDLWKAAGYQPVPLEINDILTGLQTGLIDTVCSTPSYALSGQFYTVVPHMLTLRWAPLVGGAVMTKKAWDQLAPQPQQAMRKAAAEAGVKMQARLRDENAESIEAMKKRGLIVHTVTPEIEEAWRRAAENVYPKIRGSVVPAQMFDEVQELLRQYRSSNEQQEP